MALVGGKDQKKYWFDEYLAGSFEQLDHLGEAEPEVQRGVCMATCVYWISHHMHYRSFFGGKKSTDVRIAFLKDKNRLLTIQRVQGGYKDAIKDHFTGSSDDDGYRTALSTFLKPYGLKVKATTGSVYLSPTVKYALTTRENYVQSTEGRFEDLVERLNTMTHAYHILNFDGVPGHTTCCYKSGGTRGKNTHLYIFDPNIGEMKVPADKIGEVLASTVYQYFSKEAYFSSLVAIEVEKNSTGGVT
ncbi:hypothetical protein GCM10007301_34640 [Azorhizobium oxalatiphilum]|uniref:Peptidase C58 YopT-type domain-containing protein n=1 Tax=Azorhizobium oxalatiphilum TaxID=980631 RepID=A0A917C4K9_9HYPH|nr:YopT-type cysteine protease domain-containing protein [Azorhizobium oxalatiphilum]GGF71962.1 hypothetical protein GCM10007301_34640 [Azorhizobium oxalatiphilum]